MIKAVFVFLLSCSAVVISAQDFQWADKDEIYQNYIKSVRFHMSGLFTSVPISSLDKAGTITLNFDDLQGGYRRYKYTVIHCDARWQPTNLSQMEYIEGFEEEEIRNYNYSLGTFDDYTNYRLVLPNRDFSWTLSGNYLLHVYEDRGSEIIPVMTRRFLVVESAVSTVVEFQNPADVSKMRSHQELDLTLNFRNLRITSPMRELEVTILQNGRWDNALTGITALYERNDLLVFDFQDKVIFPAGKEFRNVDIRSLKFRSEYVEAIERDRNGYFIFAKKEWPRESRNFTNESDLNGHFIIGNLDKENENIQSEYVTVQFFLHANREFENSEIFLVGRLTDWQCKEAYKLQYNNAESGYVLETRLKQGHYNYYFALVDSDRTKPSYKLLEGNWHETSNEYTILTYYREIGGRYDRLVGAQTVVYN